MARLCGEKFQKLRTLNIYFNLYPLEFWLPIDENEAHSSFEYTYPLRMIGDDENADEDDYVNYIHTYPPDDLPDDPILDWKDVQKSYYKEVKSIMTSFFAQAKSVSKVCWHFDIPREGRGSSCWLWRKVHRKGAKAVSEGTKTSSSIISDLLVRGLGPSTPRFSSAVGREAEYFKAFQHEYDRL